jgi:hypothetical protein
MRRCIAIGKNLVDLPRLERGLVALVPEAENDGS